MSIDRGEGTSGVGGMRCGILYEAFGIGEVSRQIDPLADGERYMLVVTTSLSLYAGSKDRN